MAKNKANASDSLVDQVTRLLNNLPTTRIDSSDPFVIVQHAAAQVKVAGSPDSTTRRDIVKSAAAQLFAEHDARISVLTNNN